jgi:hypothetical protein
MDNFFPIGRMLSASKKTPKGHVCVFNANLCVKSRGKIWFGDIDVTTDRKQLIALAGRLGEDIYVLREKDARFQNEAAPLYENAVARVSSTGEVEMREGE